MASVATMYTNEIGQAIPLDTPHVSATEPFESYLSFLLFVMAKTSLEFLWDWIYQAVSVSLPSWKANVGYEEGDDWVLSKMKNGYPR